MGGGDADAFRRVERVRREVRLHQSPAARPPCVSLPSRDAGQSTMVSVKQVLARATAAQSKLPRAKTKQQQ